MSKNKNKKILLITLLTSLFSCVVGGVSTFAWFQLEQRPIKSEVITGTPNITIGDNIYGYKINQTIGNNGYLSSSNDILKFGKDSTVAGTNHHQDTSDTNFNVPDDGIGYYLVKKNPGGTFKYKYSPDGNTYTSYSWKFTEYSTDHIHRAYVDNLQVSADDEFRVMHYYFSNGKTVNNQVEIATVYHPLTTNVHNALVIDSKTKDVKCADEGKYKVWLDFESNDLSFEFCEISSGGFSVRSKVVNFESDNVKNDIRKRTASTSSNSTYTKIILNDSVQWSFYTLKLENPTFSSNYTQAMFDYFIEQEYTNNVSTWDSQRTTKGYKINGSTYYLATSISNHSGTFYLPTWLTSCKLCICNSSNEIYMFYLDNLFSSSGVSYAHNTGRKYRHEDTNSLTAIGKTVTFNSYKYGNYNNTYTDFSDNFKNTSKSNYDGWDGPVFTTSITDNNGNKTWTTNTVNISHVNTNGEVLSNNTSSSNVINVNITQVPSSSLSLSGYNYAAVYYSRTNSFDSKTSTSLGAYLQVKDGLTIYLVYNKIYDVKVYASYFIDDDQSSFTESLVSTTKIEGTTYTASGYTDNRDYNDNVNAIHYTFSRVNNTTWYKTANCDKTNNNVWTNGSKITEDTNIFAKYNCEFTGNYTTFYIDIKDAYATGADNTQWGSAAIMFTNGGAKTIDALKVANYLYRVTLPNDYVFRLGNGYTEVDGRGDHFTTTIENSGGYDNRPCSHLGEIICVETTTSGNNHGFSWCPIASTTSYGTAYIQKYENNSWTNFLDSSSNPITMNVGDGSSNFFIYEHGLQILTNTKIRIKITDVTEREITSNFTRENDYYVSDYSDVENPNAAYLRSSGGDLSTHNYTGNSRFNFYVTGAGKVVVVMVPDYGNGYYIMHYSSTTGTNHYSDGIKMTSNSDYRATYDYYYATSGSEIFIRSYVNGVDTLMTTAWNLPADVHLGTDGTDDTAPGVLHFTNHGYYNITVENGVIQIEEINDFTNSSFKLNKLNTSEVNSAYKIWKQKTSLVLEIPFTCVNDYESQISLTVSNPLSAFVGVSLCVVPSFSTSKAYSIGDYVVKESQLYRFTAAHAAGSWNTSQVTEVNPYNFMRGDSTALVRSSYYNCLSSGTNITDQMNARIKSTNANDFSYAYILVDYLPTQVNAAGYAYTGTVLTGNTAYTGSVASSYADGVFLNSDTLASRITYYLEAKQV